MALYYQQAGMHFVCTGCQEQTPPEPLGEDDQPGPGRLWGEAVARWAREGV